MRPASRPSRRPHRPRADAGRWNAIAAALARVAARDGSDRWLRAAVFSSLTGRELGFLAALRELSRGEGRLQPELLNELGRLLGASQPKETWPGLVRLLVAARPGFAPVEEAGLLTGVAEAARSRLTARDSEHVLSALVGPAAGRDDMADSIRRLIVEMKRIALDGAQPLAHRRTAVGLLAFADFDQAGEALQRLVDPQLPDTLQAAAVRALGTASRRPRRDLAAGGRTVRDLPTVAA